MCTGSTTGAQIVKPTSKSIIILSSKSSGSSALQELLCEFAGGKHAEHTRHGERETLYWTKAASVLGMPQRKLPDSEVPIHATKARRELVQFLKNNVPDFQHPVDAEELVFQGWHALALRYAPVFVEKSPHHLHQWSCLELLQRATGILPDVDFRFVGLVRNPMDVLYSAWMRWRIRPEIFQQHWREAHENLERFRDVAGRRLTIVRYEDLSAGTGAARELLQQLGLMDCKSGVDTYIHASSRLKWKKDGAFGFCLNPAVKAVAKRFGYTDEQLDNRPLPTWRLHSWVARSRHLVFRRPVARIRRLMRGSSKLHPDWAGP